MKKISYLLLILLTTTLTACGGGGKNANSNTTSNSGSSSTISSGGSTTSSSGGSTSSSGGSTTGTSTGVKPQVLYTDVISGPTNGGEGNNGMYLSIFGKNFGSSLSNVKVTIGGNQVAKLYYLGSSLGRPDVQQISMQIGSLGNPTPGTALPIVVYVNGVASNNNLTFTPNPGQICYVSNAAGVTPEGTSYPAGNDATGICGDITHPFATVQGTSEYTGGAWPLTQPGDTIVLLPSSTPYQEVGFENYFMRFYRGPSSSVGGGGNAPTGSVGTGYMTLMGYPGTSSSTTPYISAPYSMDPGGAVSASDSSSTSPYIIVADLKINGGGGDGAVNTQLLSNYARVVNNDLSTLTSQSTARSGCVAGDGYYMEVLGNSCHDVDSPDTGLENHGVYLDAAGNDEIAYNFIYAINDGNGIQLYNSQGTTPNINNVSIHHNFINGVAKHGINIADSTSNGISIYDNIIANTVDAGIRFNTNTLTGCQIYNNTFYETDLANNSSYGAIMNDWNLPSNALSMENNIFIAANGTPFVGGSVGISSADGTFSNNLYFDGDASSTSYMQSLDPNAIVTNPQFASAITPLASLPNPTSPITMTATQAFDLSQFTPTSGSPMIGNGLNNSSISSLVSNDFLLNGIGTNYTIGAIQ